MNPFLNRNWCCNENFNCVTCLASSQHTKQHHSHSTHSQETRGGLMITSRQLPFYNSSTHWQLFRFRLAQEEGSASVLNRIHINIISLKSKITLALFIFYISGCHFVAIRMYTYQILSSIKVSNNLTDWLTTACSRVFGLISRKMIRRFQL